VEAFNTINDRFTTASFLITVEGTDRDRMIAAAEQIGARIRAERELDDLVDSVVLRLDEDFLNTWGLMLQEEADLRKSLRLLDSGGLVSFLRTFNDNLEETYSGDEGRDEVDSAREEINTAQFLATMGRSAELLRSALEEPGAHAAEEVGADLAEMFLLGDPYRFDSSGTMLIFRVLPTFSVTDLEAGSTLTESVRTILSDTRSQFPELRFGYAGDVAQNYDEQQAVGSDLFWPTVLAFLVILALFVFSFARARGVVFALIALGVGILTTVGFIALTLAEVNLITSTFAVLLMGLGVDFGIHLLANYDSFRGDGHDALHALSMTYRSVVPAIVIGAIATAVAFLSLLLTDTEVMHQFAVVAGGGIMITLLSMLTVLPALLLLFETGTGVRRRRLPVLGFGWISRAGTWCVRRRVVVVVAAAVLAVAGALLIPRNTFLYDLSELGPQQATSIVTQRRIERHMGFSPFPMMVAYEDMSSVRETTNALEAERMVASIASLSRYLPRPEEQQARLSLIREAREGWNPPAEHAISEANLEDLTYEIQRLEWNMIEIGQLSVAALGEGNLIQKQRDAMIREVLGAAVGEPGDEVFQKLIASIAATPDRSIERLNEIQSHFVTELRARSETLLSPDRPIRAEDLPETITDQTVSDTGEYFLVTAVPSAEVGEQEAMFRFRDRMQRIEEEMTGTIPIAIEFSESLTEEIGYATAYIGIALLVILLLTFRRIGTTVVIVLAMVASVLVMFGLFPLLGIAMNVLNMMVLPLIFGLGVDYFIHVAHRLRREQDLAMALRRTGKGVLLSAATTMIAFGSLGLIGQYRAIQLLGRMLFVGIGIVLVASLTVLPALLSWLSAGGSVSPTNQTKSRLAPTEQENRR
jgi:hypothetical protein